MLLVDIVRHATERYAEREAVVCGSQRLTYQKLIERACCLASGLQAKGYAPGDRIAIIAQNCHRVIELYIAAAISGLVIIPIKAQYAVDDIRYMLQNTDPALILASAHDVKKIAAVTAELLPIPVLWWDDESRERSASLAMGGGEYEWLIDHHSPYELPIAPDESALFALLHTTGTTSIPKAVMVTHRTQVETVMAEFSEFCFPVGTYVQPGSVLVSSGIGMMVQSMLTGGKQILLNDSLGNPEHILRAVEEEQADGARFLPHLVHVPNIDAYDLSSLRYMIQGGYPLNPHHFHMFIERFGPILIHGYGATEAGGIASLIPDEYYHDGVLEESRLRSCGHALPGVTIRIVDAEGQDVPAGTPGEIVVQTQALMPGYWGDEAATAHALRDGWLYTHDMGVLDEQAYLFLLPRNETPAGIPTYQSIDVETILCRHQAIADSAAFVRTFPGGQKHIVAVVEPHANAAFQVEELLTFCRQQGAGQDMPTEVHVIEHLPRNPVGKIMRRELRTRYLRDDPPVDPEVSQPEPSLPVN
ncbi:MAG: AMP-binding protein [Ktedonobacteraceae bacterium]|nr:AMP-binding protein [Chloroflexota bacterium]